VNITFTHLGAIKETVLDLRPLTVIIGPNNSNKTYISYSIYGILKHLGSTGRFAFAPIRFEVVNKRTLRLKRDDNLWQALLSFCDDEIDIFERSLTNFFQDSSGKLFDKTDFEVSVSKDELQAAVDELLRIRVLGNVGDATFTVETADNDLQIVASPLQAKFSEDFEIDQYFAQYLFTRQVFRQLFGVPFLLPAERNAFIITYRMLATRRFRFLRETQREIFSSRQIKPRQIELLREQGDIRYPEPIEDFLDFLAEVEFQKNIRIDSKKETELQKLADLIELSIQNKNKTNLAPTKLGGREIKVKVKAGLTIDLYNASSSIKQLAPLLLYLRYWASRGNLLIIDEPEMNLHPESQAKLLEVLAILVNLGIKVLLTTHSPYFMAHLNNLVPINGASVNGRSADRLYLKDERAFLSRDQVGAYEMRDNKLHSLADKDFGIRWDTLSEVSADLQQKFFEINENLESSSDAQE